MAQAKIKNELLLMIKSLRDAVPLFRKNDPLRMGGATAFFTTFALPPIIFILVQLFGLFISRQEVGQRLFLSISNIVGEEGAQQVREVIRSIRGFSSTWYEIVLGFIFLLFVATTLFNVIKNSLNQLWQIRVDERPGILFFLRIRARSIAVIILAGILFFADLLFESLGILAGNYIDDFWQGGGIYFKSGISRIASVLIVAIWFLLLFRYLADAMPSWKAAFIGGLLTSVLFTAGRLLLRIILINSNVGKLYGASGSLVLLLLFVFYSSFILYYGACFIAAYSNRKEWPIRPTKKAHHYNIEKV